MGAFCSSGSDDTHKISSSIDAEIDKTRHIKEMKFLLLGTGESGKSTITKQIKLIQLAGFSDDEMVSTIRTIISNIFEGILTLINLITQEKILGTFSSETQSEFEFYTSNVTLEVNLTSAVIQATKVIWQDPKVKMYMQSNIHKFKACDSLRFYLDEIDRIAAPDYKPAVKDVLLSRTRTTGISEIRFEENGQRYLFVDVGGQRSERKKWIHQFQDVVVVIFCVALSEYDQVLDEDRLKNRMHEAASLFEDICNSRWFVETKIILFFTKEDLFREKIMRVDLKCCFPTYVGGLDYDRALSFIKDHFNQLNRNPGKPLEMHTVVATDTDSVRGLLQSIKVNL
eukprot:TRINITY_DN6431_c0_g1_i1.p1 TRINITY_DN6431_c0_g1~~TRINITY_DN6431_c0_g1_i1.p1  ORF type:complete len:341 (+),score=51.81 TRINITY_DN6431_c0_g1_i1:122-1144(+)